MINPASTAGAPVAAWPACVLRVEELVVDRAERRVLDGLALKLAAGEAMHVTGRNGAGKSTLLRAVAGLTAKVRGSVDLSGWDGAISDALHLLGHLDAVKPQLTVLQNITFWVRWLGGPSQRAEARAEAALDRLGLIRLAESPAAFLSQGQRRRLSLARLVAVERPLWLLDEPTAGLDAAARTAFAEVMRAHLAAGGLILAAVHEPIGLETPLQLQLAG